MNFVLGHRQPVISGNLLAPERAEVVQRIRWSALQQALHDSVPPIERPYTPGNKSLVAIIDSGLDQHDEILPERIVARYNAIDGSDDVRADTGHGPAVAGIIAGTGTQGAGHGIAPGARLVIVKVGSFRLEDGIQTGSIPSTMLIRALEWIGQQRTAIEARTGGHLGAVCLAVAGGPLLKEPDAQWIFSPAGRAIQNLAEHSVVTVVGSGNRYHQTVPPVEGMQWPAILPLCVSVGATYDKDFSQPPRAGKADELAYYSNRILSGPHCTTIHAPGSVIHTIGQSGTSAMNPEFEGTSAATPVACGTVLLIQELYYLRKRRWPTHREVVDILTCTAKKLIDASSGRPYGLLDLGGIADAIPS